MHAQSVMLSGAVPDRSPLGWLILLPLGCLLLGQILLVLTDIIPVLDGVLVDPDGYMRLNRVIALHDGGSWFDSRYWRINPPEGHVQHWTRPLDALLLAGGLVLEPFMGFRQGLHLWGVLFSPVCLALTLIALAWAIEPVLDRDSRLFACLALLMQPTILAYSSVGRPDHHSLLLLLFVILFGLTFRVLVDPLDRSSARRAGAVAALSLWVSLESLTFVGCSMAILSVYWLLGDGRLGAQNRSYVWAMTGTLLLGVLIERGPADLFAIENDRLSILHVVFFFLVGLFWLLAASLGRPNDVWDGRRARVAMHRSRPFARPEPTRVRSRGIIGRGLLAVAGVAGVGFAMLVLFPELAEGPLGEVDPLYKELRLDRIVEIQPLISIERVVTGRFGEIANRVVQVVGIAFVAVPFLFLMLSRPRVPGRRVWAALALALAVFLPLTFYQIRWSSYAQVLLVIPYAALVAWLLAGIADRVPPSRLPLIRPLIIVAALFWPIGSAQFMPQQEIVTANEGCPIDRAGTWLNGIGPSGTILALADYGPELLYRTQHHVLSIPNHRPQPGFNSAHRALAATDPQVARAELGRHGVDWVLLCPGIVESDHFLDGRQDTGSLYQQLIDGQGPLWLQPVVLPAELADSMRLYAFEADPRPGGDLLPSSNGG
ncbi:MAG: hypothetical protein AAF637_18880 [Pseudomonadota bacterium]